MTHPTIFDSDDRIKLWLCDPLDPESQRAIVRLRALPDLHQLAIMPDVHPAADACVGSVLATRELLYPQVIGGDIGCGMTALAFRDEAGTIAIKSARAVLEGFTKRLHTKSRRDAAWTDEAPRIDHLTDDRLRRVAQRDGLSQLGTLGGGNHFIELQIEDHPPCTEGNSTPPQPRLWLMVHSGSRAMGQAIANFYSRAAAQSAGFAAGNTPPGGRLFPLPVSSAAGESYFRDQTWAVRYAAANRRALLEDAAGVVRSVLGLRPDWSSILDTPHNFLARESHGSHELLVHRKGAAPAFAGTMGMIPGSAGTQSVHVEGRGCDDALRSSSHGCGRLLSRGDARRQVSPGKLCRQLEGVAFDERRAASLVEEAPGVYRDLRRVLEAQRDLVKVVRRLRPLVSFKAV